MGAVQEYGVHAAAVQGTHACDMLAVQKRDMHATCWRYEGRYMNATGVPYAEGMEARRSCPAGTHAKAMSAAVAALGHCARPTALPRQARPRGSGLHCGPLPPLAATDGHGPCGAPRRTAVPHGATEGKCPRQRARPGAASQNWAASKRAHESLEKEGLRERRSGRGEGQGRGCGEDARGGGFSASGAC